MKDFVLKLILAVVIAIAGAIINHFYEGYQNREQSLTYKVQRSEALLGKANNIDTLALTINGKRIKDVSEVDIEVTNHTDKQFKDITVVVEFNQDSTFETIIHSSLDENQSRDLVKEVGLSPSKSVRFGFLVSQISRRGDVPVLTMKFLIKGKTIPEIKPLYSLEGVSFIDTTTIENQKDSSFDGWKTFAIVYLAVVLIILIFGTASRTLYEYDPETMRYTKALPFPLSILVLRKTRTETKSDSLKSKD
ncbi:MAG TPA: hypothetical protein VGQ59_18060 [Cyclobacteriaceae bacterium]|jgi:hypothetical protein|nr:hypothetical protein [Cyclobacteriaceae bacterium]